jgi:hypothetical protein
MFLDNGVKRVDFVSSLNLKVLPDDSFELAEDFHVAISGKLVVIPKGFLTDLASVPRLPIVYVAIGSTGHRAAVLHDYIYSIGLYARKHCDLVFYEGLKECGVSSWKAYSMYLGVRIGGASHYKTFAEAHK